jgi:hypothetical protein
MKPERYFYTFAGALFLLLTFIGFRHYILGGRHTDGSPFHPAILTLVVLHSSAVFAWFVLFFVQSLLISTQNRRLHMKLGWSVLVIGAAIALTGPVVAIRSIQVSPPFTLFGWPYSRFLLIMLTEIVLFTTFVTIGVLNRKRPGIHRPMMLMASLALLSGATSRTPFFHAVFGVSTALGFFGPVILVGALLVLTRLALTRRFDRWFVGGYAACMIVLFAAGRLALTDTWGVWAAALLKF